MPGSQHWGFVHCRPAWHCYTNVFQYTKRQKYNAIAIYHFSIVMRMPGSQHWFFWLSAILMTIYNGILHHNCPTCLLVHLKHLYNNVKQLCMDNTSVWTFCLSHDKIKLYFALCLAYICLLVHLKTSVQHCQAGVYGQHLFVDFLPFSGQYIMVFLHYIWPTCLLVHLKKSV